MLACLACCLHKNQALFSLLPFLFTSVKIFISLAISQLLYLLLRVKLSSFFFSLSYTLVEMLTSFYLLLALSLSPHRTFFVVLYGVQPPLIYCCTPRRLDSRKQCTHIISWGLWPAVCTQPRFADTAVCEPRTAARV